MTIEELKRLLSEGKITREQFEAMAKAMGYEQSEEGDKQEEGEDAAEDKPAPDDAAGDDIERRIQRAVDRATNRMGNDNKKLRQQLDALKKAKLTDDEKAELERRERDEELAERERALTEREHRLYAIKAIKKAGLDDGSDMALELIDYVMADTEDEIEAKIKSFGALVSKIVKAEVDKTFKRHGRNPEQGAAGGTDNPWQKDTWNITRQMQIELTNPEQAKQMRMAAGK